MPTDSEASDRSQSASTNDDPPDALHNLPPTVAGWENRTPESEYPLEYWKVGSTHVAGEYEQLAATPARDDDYELVNRTYDQFGHLLSTTAITRARSTRCERLTTAARTYMERYPANDPFDSPPALPTRISEWTLTTTAREQPIDTTTWEYGWGKAELTLEQTEIISHYSHTERPHTIRYQEPDSDPRIIAADVPRTQAFEIAVNTLETLEQPLSSLVDAQAELQTVTGIGPAKAKQLLALGIPTPEALQERLTADSPGINSAHTDLLETILTSQIKTDLVNKSP